MAGQGSTRADSSPLALSSLARNSRCADNTYFRSVQTKRAGFFPAQAWAAFAIAKHVNETMARQRTASAGQCIVGAA